MNKRYWVLGTPDGKNFFGMRWNAKEMEGPPGFSFPRSPMMLFATETVAREAIRFFRLPADLCATPWQLETDEQYDGFLADAWDLGARDLVVVEELTCNPRHMKATPYSFFPARTLPESEPGSGKSFLVRWLLRRGH